MPDVNGKGTAVVSRSQMASLMGAEKLRAEKRVLILASGPTAQEAPIAEARAAGSEIWGLNAVHRQVDPFLFTRFFQIHRTGSGEGHIADPDHAAWLRAWGYASLCEVGRRLGPHLEDHFVQRAQRARAHLHDGA